jgi:N-acetylmuramoyl-L-alanine amidase
MAVLIASSSFAGEPLFDRIKPMIVIDPGHGGSDAGARGAAGLLEKDVTLDLARALESVLKPAYRVRLTRTGDYDRDLFGRTESANRLAADLLISFHTGASVVQERRGIGIYYYERSGEGAPGSADSAEGLWTGEQDRFAAVSQALTRILSDHLSRGPGTQTVRVTGISAALLSAATMPAVIIEPGFITSPIDEKQMADRRMIDHLVQALRSGVDEYFSKYSKGFSRIE